MQLLLLFVTGLIVGAIDSIAGGGGLISLPALMAVVGPGVDAIGTNKIVGTLAAATAWLVYATHARRTRAASERSQAARVLVLFCLGIAAGSWTGSGVSPYFAPWVFPTLLLVTAPALLWLIWKREIWIAMETRGHGEARTWAVALAGLLAGFYDGAWGPGGGTLMLLALLFVAKRPLWEALLVSKIANTVSALVSGTHYWLGGHVFVEPGLAVGIGSVIGALVGSRFATRNATALVRPVLALVSALLIARALWSMAHA